MKLAEPLAIGSAVAPNRLLFGPHVTNLAWGRRLSHRHTEYYRARALGGCGTIVVEEAAVHDSDWPYERSPLASQAEPGWAAIVEACRPSETLVIAGLGHSGGQGSSAFSQRELWAPSDEPEVNSREIPKVMEPEDIADVVAGFAQATRRAVAAGVDGVEINGGQHSLIRQFLSGLTNRREDDYGQDRLRFAREVLQASRSSLGDGVLGLRLSCDELAPWAGLTPEAAVEVAQALAPLIDYLVVMRGSIFSVAESRPTGLHGEGFNLGLAEAIRAGIEAAIPVVAQGSIVDVAMAEEAVASDLCDGVEMTRAQIADPELGSKLASPATIRPCVLCNQKCNSRDNRNPIVSCIVEPRSGFETIDPDPAGQAGDSRDVLVVGGGPAGLEAARVAALRGHRVTVLERQPRSGGAARYVANLPGHHRFDLLADWLTDAASSAGATIRYETSASVELVDSWAGPVIIATGSQPLVSDLLADQDRSEVGVTIISALDVLQSSSNLDAVVPHRVLVWDPIGNSTGVGVAELLATSGREVTLVTPDQVAGTQLALTGDLAGANVRLQQQSVTIERRYRIRQLQPGAVVVEHTFTGTTKSIETEAVVDCSLALVDDQLGATDRPEATAVGDAVAARTVGDAIREGRAAALALEQEGPSLEPLSPMMVKP